jgi:hypothetical protein
MRWCEVWGGVRGGVGCGVGVRVRVCALWGCGEDGAAGSARVVRRVWRGRVVLGS